MATEEILMTSNDIPGLFEFPIEADGTLTTATTSSFPIAAFALWVRKKSGSTVGALGLTADVGPVRVEAAGRVRVGRDLAVAVIAERGLVHWNADVVAHLQQEQIKNRTTMKLDTVGLQVKIHSEIIVKSTISTSVSCFLNGKNQTIN